MKDRVAQQQLNELLHQVRENESKLEKFARLEQRLVAAINLIEMLQILLVEFPVDFSLQAVLLVLLDRDGEWKRTLGEDAVQRFAARGLRLCPDFLDAGPDVLPVLRPSLSRFEPKRHGGLFANLATQPGSVAILPLLRQEKLMGQLCLASERGSRFADGDGTLFLERMATFMVLCLQNALYFERLERSSWLDGLTQVNNRRYFDTRLIEAVHFAFRHNQKLSLAIFDLDHFKRVNDKWGHQAGDFVLQQTAQLIRSHLRNSDSFARYGGEEFVALLPGTPQEAAIELARRILQAVADFHFGQTMQLRLTVSIGVAQLGQQLPSDMVVSAQGLVGRADAALYRAKRGGRNRVVGA